jgi:hypothetical protein
VDPPGKIGRWQWVAVRDFIVIPVLNFRRSFQPHPTSSERNRLSLWILHTTGSGGSVAVRTCDAFYPENPALLSAAIPPSSEE